jgi:anhydro-N-acetylmuramic acid kinase
MDRILNRIISKNQKHIIGLLSGTSVDGIDAVLVKIQGSGTETKVKVIDFVTVKIPVRIRNSVLRNSDNKTAKVAEITRLNMILGNLFAKAVRIIQKRNPSLKIDLIGSHGQTIHHLSEKKEFLGYKVKSTLQIGDPSVIANVSGFTTIGDFRIADCSVGGEGAPLVPYLDYILFRSGKLNRGLLNIGGIANITILPKSCSKNDVIAFDTGPGNMIIDSLMQKLYNKPFDRNSSVAKKGLVNDKLFKLLLNDKYYKLRPPKSTGREHYGSEFVEKILENTGKIPGADIIRTVTEFTAYSIWSNYEKFIRRKVQIDELIVSGGGANNPVIMKSLKNYFREVKIKRMDSYGIDPDSKEAVLFAVLANECLAGNCANMKSVTGSKKDVILGKICLAN